MQDHPAVKRHARELNERFFIRYQGTLPAEFSVLEPSSSELSSSRVLDLLVIAEGLKALTGSPESQQLLADCIDAGYIRKLNKFEIDIGVAKIPTHSTDWLNMMRLTTLYQFQPSPEYKRALERHFRTQQDEDNALFEAMHQLVTGRPSRALELLRDYPLLTDNREIIHRPTRRYKLIKNRWHSETRSPIPISQRGYHYNLWKRNPFEARENPGQQPTIQLPRPRLPARLPSRRMPRTATGQTRRPRRRGPETPARRRRGRSCNARVTTSCRQAHWKRPGRSHPAPNSSSPTTISPSSAARPPATTAWNSSAGCAAKSTPAGSKPDDVVMHSTLFDGKPTSRRSCSVTASANRSRNSASCTARRTPAEPIPTATSPLTAHRASLAAHRHESDSRRTSASLPCGRRPSPFLSGPPPTCAPADPPLPSPPPESDGCLVVPAVFKTVVGMATCRGWFNSFPLRHSTRGSHFGCSRASNGVLSK
jgi:hypothetical protein